MSQDSKMQPDVTTHMCYRLQDVLNKYYRVGGKSFDECTATEISKHQVLHLAKLTKKMVVHLFGDTDATKTVVTHEVVPDILIYAQELMFKCELEPWMSPHMTGNVAVQPLRTLLNSETKFSSLTETLIAVCKATAALADICDQADHDQKSLSSVETDVIAPFLRAAATLTEIFNLDIDTLYAKRLQQMKEKYERWS